MKPLAFHPTADEEYVAAAAYYAQISTDLGRRFYDEIERLLSDIRQHPARFWLWDPPARRHFSDVFPYAVLYVDQPDRIWVVAVMHLKQEPGYWKSRLT